MKLPFLLTIDDLPIGQISRGWGGSTWGHRLKIATWQPTAVKQPQSDAQTFQTLFSYFLKKSVLSILAIHKYNDGKFPFFLFVMGSVSATSNFGDFHWSLFNKCIYSQCSSFRRKMCMDFVSLSLGSDLEKTQKIWNEILNGSSFRTYVSMGTQGRRR